MYDALAGVFGIFSVWARCWRARRDRRFLHPVLAVVPVMLLRHVAHWMNRWRDQQRVAISDVGTWCGRCSGS